MRLNELLESFIEMHFSPIGQEYYDDIDAIRDKIYNEIAEANKREMLNDSRL